MTELKAGSAFPQDVTFSYIPYTPEIESVKACGIPQNYKASAGTSFLPSASGLPAPPNPYD